MKYKGFSRGLLLLGMIVSLSITPASSDAAASSVPVSDQARIEMGRSLFWLHTCPGDYNQDGLVNASDITPLGANLNESALPDAFPSNTQFSLIDGDQNGMLTVADLTTIGANFGSDVLGGYNVYAADNLDEYPDGNDELSKFGAHLMGNVALADTLTENGATAIYGERRVPARKTFDFDVEYPLEYRYWWVRAVDKDGNEGTPSEVVTDPGSKVPRNDLSAAVASWDGGTMNLSWNYYNLGDYDCNGAVDASDVHVIGAHYGYPNLGDPNSAAGVIDTDGSGIVDEGDLEALKANWGHFIYGYNVYASASQDDYPDSNDARSELEPYSSMVYVGVDFPRDPYRPVVTATILDATPGTYLWVRPYDWLGFEGTPSNLVVVN